MVNVLHTFSIVEVCTETSTLLPAAIKCVFHPDHSCILGEYSLYVIRDVESGPTAIDFFRWEKLSILKELFDIRMTYGLHVQKASSVKHLIARFLFQFSEDLYRFLLHFCVPLLIVKVSPYAAVPDRAWANPARLRGLIEAKDLESLSRQIVSCPEAEAAQANYYNIVLLFVRGGRLAQHYWLIKYVND